MVLVTDKETDFTVAIFNYEKIEWAASTELGGNSKTGLSTTNAAQVQLKYIFLLFEKIPFNVQDFKRMKIPSCHGLWLVIGRF